jgi:cellulose synthase (UDP-forming)
MNIAEKTLSQKKSASERENLKTLEERISTQTWPDSPLPTPPSLVDRYAYINPFRGWAYFGLFACLCVFYSSCWFLWQSHLWFYGFYILLTAFWTFPHFIFIVISKNFDLTHHIQVVQESLSDRSRPSVDVFIPTCGESLEIIENTFYHASKLTYRPLQLYALDDGDSPEVKKLAEKYGLQYLSRPNRGEMKKAGNLLYGYQRSKGDFILVLDADFAVSPCALEHLVPWVKQDDRIAILQTPQYFETASTLSWSARGAAYCQEVFYRVIQPARDYLGRSAICVGTNALYRREALGQIGGFYQTAASEDVHNGVALINQGWQIKYVPILVARGLCPGSLQDLFKQHYRWCSGSMKLITSRFFWGSGMPVWQKLIYFCGACYYPSAALALPVALFQLGTAVFWFQGELHWYFALLFLPKVLLVYLIMPLWNQANWGLHSIKAALTFSWAYLIAIWDLITQQTEGWIASGSSQKSARYVVFKRWLIAYCVFHILLLLPVFHYEWYHFMPLAATHCFAIYLSLDLLKDR